MNSYTFTYTSLFKLSKIQLYAFSLPQAEARFKELYPGCLVLAVSRKKLGEPVAAWQYKD